VTTGGTLAGDGSIASSVLNIGGTVDVGYYSNASRLLTVSGSYIQEPGATLRIELAGTNAGAAVNGYDRLAVGGSAAFGGTLRLELANVFNPPFYSSYKVLTSTGPNSRGGGEQFDAIQGVILPGGKALAVTYPADHSVTVTAALPGDANLDRTVNLLDFNVLASNFGFGIRNWSGGDFNGDSLVNLLDFNLLAGNFGLSAGADGVVDASDWSALAAAIPEPSAGLPLVLAVTCLRARRRRSSRSSVS
jgi:hypothetical protein